MALSIHNVQRTDHLSIFKPSNSVSKDIDHTLRGVFVDNDSEGKPVIYDIENAGIMELNGSSTSFDMSISDFNWLLLTMAQHVEDTRSLLYILLQKYQKKSTENSMTFLHYISQVLTSNQKLESLTRTRKDDKTFMSDIDDLSTTVRQALLDDRFIVRYEYVYIASCCFILLHIYTFCILLHIASYCFIYTHSVYCFILLHIASYCQIFALI